MNYEKNAISEKFSVKLKKFRTKAKNPVSPKNHASNREIDAETGFLTPLKIKSNTLPITSNSSQKWMQPLPSYFPWD